MDLLDSKFSIHPISGWRLSSDQAQIGATGGSQPRTEKGTVPYGKFEKLRSEHQ